MKRRALLLLAVGVAAAVALVVGGCGGDNGANTGGGYTLTVKRNPANGGTTNPANSQSGISAGEAVNITATAASGYTFNGWTLSGSGIIDNAGVATTSVTVNGNVTVTANFAENSGGGNNNCTSGATCKQVTIGTQVWMAENLNIAAISGGSWCYDNSADSCNKYGRLYTWATATTVCPAGWHLPSRAEWDTLENFVGESAGKKLKSTSGWKKSSSFGDDVPGTDEYGFSALPGGRRNYPINYFSYSGIYGYWWTATEISVGNAYYREMFNNSLGGNWVIGDPDDKSLGFSVRCVGD